MDGPQQRKPVGQELIIPGLAVAFTAYYFWTVQELAWEAKANGIVIGAILLVLVAILLVRLGWQFMKGMVSLRVTLGGDRETNLARVALLVLLAVFLLALPVLGTSISLALMLFAGMWILGGRHWPTLLGVSIATPLLVWFSLIYLLGTRFPAGPFENAMASLLGIAD